MANTWCQTTQCREEPAELTALVTAGRAGGPLQAPPPDLWDRVAAEIAAEQRETEGAGGGDAGPGGAGRDPAVGGDGGPGSAPPAPAAPRGPGSRRDTTRPAGRREPRRGRLGRAGWLAAGLAAGVAGTLVVTQLTGGPEAPETLATAQLEPLPGWEETGAARIEVADGRQVLHVEVTGATPDGYREVWLLDEAVEQLVSVGLLVGTEGTFDLPEGLDLDELVVVDVSREPFDGDPAHSGDSIVRGRLDS